MLVSKSTPLNLSGHALFPFQPDKASARNASIGGCFFERREWVIACHRAERVDCVPCRINDLAAVARQDCWFSKTGSTEDVGKRRRDGHADRHAFGAVDDAEIDWLAY
ncbi:hypothetical protein [Glacieibacterium sp.]|uniref:hypothetical protein n=1 Tax=Glacieibacterium sp. TaxID=2860237 RepID=UPI003AFFE8C2